MTYGYPAPPAQAKPPISGADLGISVAAILLTILFGACAAFIGVFGLAFMDSCQPPICSAEGAIFAVGIALLVAAAIGTTGIVMTIVKLVRRARAWPYAIGTFALCVIACGLGAGGFVLASGMTW